MRSGIRPMPGGSSRRRAIGSGSCGAGRRPMPPTLLGTGRLRPTPRRRASLDQSRRARHRRPRAPVRVSRAEQHGVSPAGGNPDRAGQHRPPRSRPRADRGVRGVEPHSAIFWKPRSASTTAAPTRSRHASTMPRSRSFRVGPLPVRASGCHRRARRSSAQDVPRRPVATYSIVARDSATGEIGVAVQSHWFSVGSAVPWAEAGVGAVATQSFTDPSYGALGLDLMRAGKSASDALRGLVAADPDSAVRQVAMIDARGRAAAFTGNARDLRRGPPGGKRLLGAGQSDGQAVGLAGDGPGVRARQRRPRGAVAPGAGGGASGRAATSGAASRPRSSSSRAPLPGVPGPTGWWISGWKTTPPRWSSSGDW